MSVIPIQNRVGLFSNYIIDVIIKFFIKYDIHVKILMYINEIFLCLSNINKTVKTKFDISSKKKECKIQINVLKFHSRFDILLSANSSRVRC